MLISNLGIFGLILMCILFRFINKNFKFTYRVCIFIYYHFHFSFYILDFYSIKVAEIYATAMKHGTILFKQVIDLYKAQIIWNSIWYFNIFIYFVI